MSILLFLSLAFIIIALAIWANRLKKSLKEHFIIEKDLQYEVGHDALTGLASASLTIERLDQSIINAQRYKHKVAVLYLRVSYFKQINNTSHFDIDNELLQVLSKRLLESADYSEIVARVNANEFIVILDNVDDLSAIEESIEKIMQVSKEVFKIRHHQINTCFHLGASAYPDCNVDSINLLSNAYAAMNMIDSKTSAYKFYSPKLAEQAVKNEKLEYELVDSIKNNQLEAYYQLQFDAKTNTHTGLEALLRWRHPTVGILLADDFLTLSEEIGFIGDIDAWVLQEATEQFHLWHEARLNPGTLFLNISMKNLQNDNFIDKIKSTLAKYKCLENHLCIEINETQVMEYGSTCIEKLNILQDLGIKLALDNFGTALSSLTYLQELPIDTLKINNSTLMDLETSEDKQRLVKTTIAIAQNMNLGISVTGVKTLTERDFFIEHFCFNMQGYFYHKPANKDKIKKELKEYL